jgi:hypothetical protein
MHIFANISGYITGKNIWIITFKYIWIITHLYYKPRIWDAHPAVDFRTSMEGLRKLGFVASGFTYNTWVAVAAN